ncbi:MAG TPA: hypothetical protein VE974_08580 [Thermoanaerobaculia bacterium]|nr:hypothetical protein [Thermoanaerobaculia bacterium]
MRQMNLVGRGVLAVAVVMVLAVPAQGRTKNEEQGWSGPGRDQIAKILKIVKKVKGVIRTFGDGLSDPKP